MDGGDIISSIPDEILHHILSFLPTDSTIITSVLSKRWRPVWCEIPTLYINGFITTSKENINQTQKYYKAPKITSLNLHHMSHNTAPQIDSWILFAVSRHVQNMSLKFGVVGHETYNFPDIFYLSSSLTQLSVDFGFKDMILKCRVSWKSLRNLSLSRCNLSEESIVNILSGCPKLESLTLSFCELPERLDLSESLSLTRLEIKSYFAGRLTEIVAPHIHCLRMSFDRPCTLVDVSSLTEANLVIINDLHITLEVVDFLQTMVLKMLEKLRNIERLTVGGAILQILSLAELCGVPLPTFKVQTLIVKTRIVRSVIHGIARLLQNSPGLEKLIVVHTTDDNSIRDEDFNSYLGSQGVNPYQCWRSEYMVFPTSPEFYLMLRWHTAISELLASFLELVLRNTKTIDTLVVLLGGIYIDNAQLFEELLQMVQTLSHNSNDVSIELKRSNY